MHWDDVDPGAEVELAYAPLLPPLEFVAIGGHCKGKGVAMAGAAFHQTADGGICGNFGSAQLAVHQVLHKHAGHASSGVFDVDEFVLKNHKIAQ